MPLGPFDLTGGPFLALYAALLVGAVIAGIVIPHRLRPEGRESRLGDPTALAMLSGGAQRFVDAIMTRLLAKGSLVIAANKAFAPNRQAPVQGAAEQRVLALPQPIRLSAIDSALKPHARSMQQSLVSAGLLMDGSEALRIRFWQTVPYLALILFGAIKWDIGVARDRPVGYLTLLLVVTAVLALIRFLVLDRKTRGGVAVLNRAREESDRLRRAPTLDETGMAVALFGPAVLAGSSLAAYHQLRSVSGDGGTGADGGGDGGGGGCGGGGCGGCGG